MLQRKYNMWKNKSVARTVSIEAVLQPRFHYAMNYFSFDAEVLFAFFVFGDTFLILGLMVHTTYRFRLRLAPFSGLFWPFFAIFDFMVALIFIINVVYLIIII